MTTTQDFFSLVYAPNEIFKKIAGKVDVVDDSIRLIADKMLNTLRMSQGIGIAANMAGILKRIVVINLPENAQEYPMILINPEIIHFSQEKQTFREASLSFPGIEAEITRPKTIKVLYFDYRGIKQEFTAEGLLSTVIQHEVDYLNGKIFLDYVSKLKRDTLLKKMTKYLKLYPPHVHNEHCQH